MSLYSEDHPKIHWFVPSRKPEFVNNRGEFIFARACVVARPRNSPSILFEFSSKFFSILMCSFLVCTEEANREHKQFYGVGSNIGPQHTAQSSQLRSGLSMVSQQSPQRAREIYQRHPELVSLFFLSPMSIFSLTRVPIFPIYLQRGPFLVYLS